MEGTDRTDRMHLTSILKVQWNIIAKEQPSRDPKTYPLNAYDQLQIPNLSSFFKWKIFEYF